MFYYNIALLIITMSSKSIINPKTNRAIAVGSKVWKNLVKEGIIQGDLKNEKELYELKDSDDVESKIEELNETLPSTQQAVRGRHSLKGKLVIRNKAPDIMTMTKQISKRAVSALKENKERFEELDESDWEDQLENLIVCELVKNNETKSLKNVKKHQQKDKTPVYELEEPSD